MSRVLMMRGAGRILDECAGLEAGESVVILTDFRMTALAEVLACAAHERNADVVVVTMTPREFDGAEPPDPAGRALLGASLIVSLVSPSVTHSTAVKAAIEAGGRGVMLTAFIEDQLIGGGIDADFRSIEPLCLRIAELLGSADQARLTAPGGTDLSMNLKGRAGNAHTGLATRGGTFTTLPNIEASISPVEGTSEGILVADASIPYFGIGLLTQPVTYSVTAGSISNISGGSQAATIGKKMASCKDSSAYNIAQLSFGLNPLCTMRGVMQDDEGVYGTSHIGIGTSTSLGGIVKAPMHYDALLWRPTLVLDGEEVLRDGVWLLSEAEEINRLSYAEAVHQ